MTTAETTKLMTAEELFRLGDSVRGELIRGVFCEMSPAGFKHNVIAANLGGELRNFIKPRGLGQVAVGDTGVWLERGPDTVRAPDVAFMPAERLPLDADEDSYLDVVPDLVGEVRSRNDTRRQVHEKAQMWLSHGVRLCWAVYPDTRTIDVHRPGAPVLTLTDADTLDGADVLPGFTCAVSAIFEV